MKAKEIFELKVYVVEGKHSYVGDGYGLFWVDSDMLNLNIELEDDEDAYDALMQAYDGWCMAAIIQDKPDPEGSIYDW